nr:MAG TPA: hypothetical protein [Caudoviricetes sp.]
MSRFGHIVERCKGSCAQPELHRGVKDKDQLPETSCFCGPQLIYSWSTGRDASPETLPAMVQTVGTVPNSPRDWPRLGRLHIGAGLSRLSNPIRVPL